MFDIKTSDAAITAYGRIARNGVPIGIEQNTNSITYVTKSRLFRHVSRRPIERAKFPSCGHFGQTPEMAVNRKCGGLVLEKFGSQIGFDGRPFG